MSPLALFACFLTCSVWADSVFDPTSADSRIGDGPEDVITAQAFQCVDPATSIVYYVQEIGAAASEDACWRVDLRRPIIEP